jgi:hypothetical protein
MLNAGRGTERVRNERLVADGSIRLFPRHT